MNAAIGLFVLAGVVIYTVLMPTWALALTVGAGVPIAAKIGYSAWAHNNPSRFPFL